MGLESSEAVVDEFSDGHEGQNVRGERMPRKAAKCGLEARCRSGRPN